MGLTLLFGDNGFFTNLTGINIHLYGLTGIVIGATLYSCPMAFLMLTDIFQYEDFTVYVFEYLVNEYLVYDKDHYNPGKILKGQKSEMENYPDDIKYADMTGIDDLGLKNLLAVQLQPDHYV
ncbi:hypothetical protein NE673_17705 [Blautia producta]|uniref:hypothetical protein n=1 Tax=Blautia producta TaxID=33035 RepID=UPI00210CF6E1|nr:hypothetical protein [Blautia producta]MCQ5095889.1 hypothetical protein [Blautia producta]